ncbi:zinc finger CCCH domain-containing 56-like [Chlorella sorokiniana]|uniref:Zinc finger CCCH domain-containing 56-like n=1 Tax=Chlorella sorokiniana TaxID=3076 RepID=A0A2P6TFD8_CHLSO|nr:zinc finger CCCH domain-containing 56-like [Chlorella sorokiniana]|eukprot:PRW32687.1 zinc finger CCCH domain-containing 56-like [Chlorella sorokiniana]
MAATKQAKTDQLCKNPKPCSYGDRCIFAHNMEEQRRFRQAYGTGGGGGGGGGGSQGAGGKAGAPNSYCHPDKYKTALCYYFERQGYCTRGDQCNFAHGEAELRPDGQRGRDSITAEFSPAPPPPPAVRVPSSSASVAGDSAAGGGSARSVYSMHSGEADVEGGIAPTELDEAYALQLQYDEQRCLKEEAQQAQRARQASLPAEEGPAGSSYAAAGSVGTEEVAAVAPPPGLVPLPRLDSEAAFPSLQAAGGRSKAGSETARSRAHSRAPSSGGCSAAGGASPVTACPSKEGTQRAPSSCDASVAAEAELAVHGADGAEGTAYGTEGVSKGRPAAEEQEGEEEQQHEGLECGVEGEVAAAAQPEAGGAACSPRSSSSGSWADEAEAEEAEEAARLAAAAAPALLPPPPPPASARQPQPRTTPPAEMLLQALRSSSAAAAAATAAAVPADIGSPVRHAMRPLPAYRPRSCAAVHSPQPKHRLQPSSLVGANGGVDLSVIPHFVCPLTNRPFVDPVVAADGVTYERDVIEFLLYRKNIELSPVLRGVRLEHNLLTPNTALLCAMGEVAALLASWAAAQ